MNRRKFLSASIATLGLSSMSGCIRAEKLPVEYEGYPVNESTPPENFNYYFTSNTEIPEDKCMYVQDLQVEGCTTASIKIKTSDSVEVYTTPASSRRICDNPRRPSDKFRHTVINDEHQGFVIYNKPLEIDAFNLDLIILPVDSETTPTVSLDYISYSDPFSVFDDQVSELEEEFDSIESNLLVNLANDICYGEINNMTQEESVYTILSQIVDLLPDLTVLGDPSNELRYLRGLFDGLNLSSSISSINHAACKLSENNIAENQVDFLSSCLSLVFDSLLLISGVLHPKLQASKSVIEQIVGKNILSLIILITYQAITNSLDGVSTVIGELTGLLGNEDLDQEQKQLIHNSEVEGEIEYNKHSILDSCEYEKDTFYTTV